MEDMGKWKGLFEWSMKYQESGSDPTVEPLTEERRKWLEEAFSHYMQDWVARMKDIKRRLDQPAGGNASQSGDGLEKGGLEAQYQLLEELQEIVEQLDFARDLHTIGGLPTLLTLMGSPDAGLRWRAADVAATCVANHIEVQKDFVDGGAMAPLLPLLDDSDAMVQTKALLALSAITQHCPPAQDAFAVGGGLAKTVGLCSSPETRTRRKALNFLQRLLREGGRDTCAQAVEAGAASAAVRAIGDSNEHVVEVALGVLVELSGYEEGVGAVRGTERWQEKLHGVQTWLQGLTGSDAEAARESAVSVKVLSSRLGLDG